MSLYEWFVTPIEKNGWFNPVNTLTYGIILIVGVFLVYRLLKRMNIKIDRYFLISILPFIFWASSMRVIRDYIFTKSPVPTYSHIYTTAYSHVSTFIPFPPVALLYSVVTVSYTHLTLPTN